jgi:hypothetical protein
MFNFILLLSKLFSLAALFYSYVISFLAVYMHISLFLRVSSMGNTKVHYFGLILKSDQTQDGADDG